MAFRSSLLIKKKKKWYKKQSLKYLHGRSEREGWGRGGASPLRCCGVNILPIKTFLKFSAKTKDSSNPQKHSLEVPWKKNVFLKIDALK